MNVFIILGLALFLALSLYRREWGIYLIILGLPSYQIRFTVFGIPATFLEGMILLLAAIAVIDLLRDPQRIFRLMNQGLSHWLFIALFLLAAGVSVFTAPDLLRAGGIFKAYFLEAALFYMLVRLIIDSPDKLRSLFQSLAGLVLYLALFGIYQYLTLTWLPPSWWDVGFDERRIISLLNHPNALALLLGPVLALLIFWRDKTWLIKLALTLGLPAFYLTFSRAGWLALVATVLVFTLLQFKKTGALARDWKKLVAIGLVAIVLLIAIPVSRNKLISLLGADPSKQNRYVLWSAAADILKQHPVVGVGLMGFREAYKNYPLGPDRVVQNYPHNFFLNFWLETSLLGLISMLGLLLLYAKKIRNLLRTESRSLALAAGAAMTMIVMHSLVDVSYFKNDLAVLFWLIYSLPELGYGLD